MNLNLIQVYISSGTAQFCEQLRDALRTIKKNEYSPQ